jgi:predicted DNA-binding protein YlxM (UPF0122 family)
MNGKVVTHEDRAKRRKCIEADAIFLSSQYPIPKVIKLLIDKYQLSEPYIRKIISTDVTQRHFKTVQRESLVKRALKLNGSDSPGHVRKILAKEYGYSVSYIKNILMNDGVKLIGYKLRNLVTEEAVKQKLKAGMTVEEIAIELGCSRQNIYRYYHRLCKQDNSLIAADLRSRNKALFLDHLNKYSDKVIELYKAGKSRFDISQALDIPMYLVDRIISKANPLSIIKSSEDVASNSKRQKWLAIIGDLFNVDLTVTDIALKYNKNQSAVSALIKDCRLCGIPVPNRIDGRSKEYRDRDNN